MISRKPPKMGTTKFLFSAILVCSMIIFPAASELVEDQQALIDFIEKINHSRKLNWDDKTSVCNGWTGVTCNHDRSRVVAVRLPAVGFRGSVPSKTISRLSALQILSLRSNDLTGPFPSDLLQLGSLMSLYLQDNKFDGPLPLEFSLWKNLTVLNLSNNDFNGSIPSSVANLSRLAVLNLSNNSLSGQIPDINISTLQLLDLSNNKFTGALPQSLLRFPSSSFAGNNVSLENSPPMPPPLAPGKHSFDESSILGIVIGSCVVAFVSIALILIVSNQKKKGDDDMPNSLPSHKKENSLKRMSSENDGSNTRVVFFEASINLAFDLEDLLRASAEVLGKGTFGTTYKAALEDAATTVAVKRLKQVTVGRREFDQQMAIVGNIQHENVAPLRGYYYSKDEKLMVYDYYNLGSVSSLLHVKRSENQKGLDWETRLQIAVGAARGLAHVHNEKLVHGNVKASNLFLNSEGYGCVSDIGLATLMGLVTIPVNMAAGYRAPEVTDTRKVSQPSDVYSFGVVLLELLTRKSPVQSYGGKQSVPHLVRWVQSVVREEWTGEVFDAELLKYHNIEEQMVAMLQIGMSCVAKLPGQRPKMAEVVRMLEDIASVNNTGNSQSAGMRSPASTPSLTPHVADEMRSSN